jgi:hypothetical protein
MERYCNYCGGEVELLCGGYRHKDKHSTCNVKVKHKKGGMFANVAVERLLSKKETHVGR